MQTKEGHRRGIASEHIVEISRFKSAFLAAFCFPCIVRWPQVVKRGSTPLVAALHQVK